MSLFVFKKALSALLLPLPIAIFLIVAGLIILWCRQHKGWPTFLISCGLIILLVFSYQPLPGALINTLESKYTPITTLPKGVSDVVVLGGGVRADTTSPPNTQLSSASLSRLVEAIRLYELYQRKDKRVKLVLSGGRVFGKPAESGVLENTAVILGVNPKNIILERGSQNTREEAQYLKPILGKKPFLLVTSATHMPRAMYLFNRYGLKPIAAPTQYSGDKSSYSVGDYFPQSTNLVRSDIAIHEFLGKLWAHWYLKFD
ncbi:MAG: YdcF family protein [Gammaproteobacteria bacterium]|nr:YdcF family protein [Gammaproteobacteria bacterium]MCH9744828.1 YdcF family protein [Gammaproteobacteria bacterium]